MAGRNLALAITGGGLLFIWSGIRGASVLGSLRDVVAGKAPKGGANAITGSSGSSGSSGGTSGSIAQDAMRYEGTPYVWGGANPPAGADCSGLVNAVVGRDLHMAIPGYPNGMFAGHGPVTGQWFAWSGGKTVKKALAQPGDIVCWLSHMGIVTGPGQMISALNQRLGTKVTSFDGAAPPGEPMRVMRLL